MPKALFRWFIFLLVGCLSSCSLFTQASTFTPTPNFLYTFVAPTSTTTPSPTSTQTPVPSLAPAVQPPSEVEHCLAVHSLTIRSGPGKEFDSLGYLLRDECIRLLSRSADSLWVQFERGWIYAPYLVTGTALSQLPVLGDVSAPSDVLTGSTGSPLTTAAANILATFTPSPPPASLPVQSSFSPFIPDFGCLPQRFPVESALVTRVIDGVTIEVQLSGAVRLVRYIGIQSPGTGSSSSREAGQAADINRSLVEGRDVLLVRDVSEVDSQGSLLRYVLVDQLFVNDEMVKQGFASVFSQIPDTACQALFLSSEAYARANKLGIWAVVNP